MVLANLPEINVNGTFELLKADVDKELDGVWVVESQGVRLGLVLLCLEQVVLQLVGERGRESGYTASVQSWRDSQSHTVF